MLSNYVFLLNADKTPLDLISPARARKLQSKGKAAVFRQYPYVLILKEQIENPTTKTYSIKIDPGSKWSGFAIQCGDEILLRMELKHRGSTISLDLQNVQDLDEEDVQETYVIARKRFKRTKPVGWLAPSLKHRLLTVVTWIKRFIRYCPVNCIEIEQVKFDTQKLLYPEISGVEYQQGSLMGYEVREYLLEKWGRKCVYCGVDNVPLEVEHIQPSSRGGSDRVSNLTLACHTCNQAKGNKNIEDFLSQKPDILKKIKLQVKQPLRDAAAVNSTRLAIVKMAQELSQTVKCWSGGRTKFNRCSQGLEKSHSIDAACAGSSGAAIKLLTDQPLIVTCRGHGSRQARRVNASGFPAVTKPKAFFKHITAGDMVKIMLLKDRKNVMAGTYTARVKTPTPKGCEVLINGHRIGISTMKDLQIIMRSDGYSYAVVFDSLSPRNIPK